MPTVTVSPELLHVLGASLAGVNELDRDAKRLLEALLVSRGFDLKAAIRVSPLPRAEGFLLTQ
jgi:hypothetical protein